MEENKRIALEQRRLQLQTKLKAEAFVKQYFEPILEVLDYLKEHEVDFCITGLVSIPENFISYIEEILNQIPYSNYSFPCVLPNNENEKLLHEVELKFPSNNSFRYVPNLPQFVNDTTVSDGSNQREGLRSAVAALNLSDQPVFLYYLRYPLLLEVSLSDLCKHNNEDLFNFWHGDAFIFSKDVTWLIAFSMEEEWFGGKCEKNIG